MELIVEFVNVESRVTFFILQLKDMEWMLILEGKAVLCVAFPSAFGRLQDIVSEKISVEQCIIVC